MPADLKSLFPEEIEEMILPLGLEKYRAKQIFEWMTRGVSSFDEMTNISKKQREILSGSFVISHAEPVNVLRSKTDGTLKILCAFPDGAYAECVALPYEHGISACISTQSGCRMGCSFCASTKAGFTRNLLPGEMISQIQLLNSEKQKEDPGFFINHVVMMGIGEPLDNYENSVRFLRLVNHPSGLGIGMRNISLSTCGLVDKINRLAKEDLQITLSVSLHAPDNEIRSKLMPVNNKYCVEELIEACRGYIASTGRRISFEYSMISGVNDSPYCAQKLSDLLSGMLCHVNLIPVNSIKERDFRASDKKALRIFRDILTKNHINSTVRRTMGADISAACGQLRAKNL